MQVVRTGTGAALTAAVWLGLAGQGAAQELPACARYPLAEDSHSCSCAPDAPARLVWGSGPYTADSDICTAARHAGLLTGDGGEVLVVKEPGLDAYEGSTQNGVTSGRWGRFGASIAIVALDATASEAEGAEICTELSDEIETRCFCPADGVNEAIWGAGPYATGSDLCTAARHAGAIGLAGGEISLIRVPGLTSYRPTERNGILSLEWGDNDESFIVNANN